MGDGLKRAFAAASATRVPAKRPNSTKAVRAAKAAYDAANKRANEASNYVGYAGHTPETQAQAWTHLDDCRRVAGEAYAALQAAIAEASK